jgi:hypothetical protein
VQELARGFVFKVAECFKEYVPMLTSTLKKYSPFLSVAVCFAGWVVFVVGQSVTTFFGLRLALLMLARALP